MKTKTLTKIHQQAWLQKQETDLVRAELNLCKLLFIWETSQSKKKSKVIEHQERLPDGSIRTKRITIGKIGKNEAGVFTVKRHFKTLLALIKIYEDAGRPEIVTFGVHQLAENLNRSWSGKTYKELKNALLELRKIPIDFENTFFNKKTGETEEFIESFTWLENLILCGKLKNNQPNLAISSFTFDKHFRKNILDGYTKPLFLSIIINLKTEIAILLYNHIDLIMSDKYHYERNLNNLILEDFKLDGKYPYASDRKKLFLKPINELKGIKLTTGILSDIKIERTKDGKDYKIVCHKTKPTIKLLVQEKKNTDNTSPATKLVNYFHTLIDPQNGSDHPATKKELQQAKELINKCGEKQAIKVVAYAVKKGKTTNYEMQWFGAIVDYTNEALKYLEKDIERENKLQEQMRQQEAEAKLEFEYAAYWGKTIEDYKAGLSKEELNELFKAAQEESLEKHPFMRDLKRAGKEGTKTFETTIKSNFNDWLINKGKVEVLEYEDWLAQKSKEKPSKKQKLKPA